MSLDKPTPLELRERFKKQVDQARATDQALGGMFGEFKPEEADRRRKEKRGKVIAEMDTGLGIIGGHVDKALADVSLTIRTARYPDLTSTDVQRRMFGSMEQLNAAMVGELYPVDLLREAVATNRLDFASSLIDRALSAPSPHVDPAAIVQQGLDPHDTPRNRFVDAANELFKHLDSLHGDEKLLRELREDVVTFRERVRDDFDVGPIPRELRASYPSGQLDVFPVKG